MKKYYKELKKIYPIITQAKVIILVSIIFISIDILGLPSKIIAQFGLFLFVLISIGGFSFIGLFLAEHGVFGMFRTPLINSVDLLCVVMPFSLIFHAIFMIVANELTLWKIIVSGILLMSSVICFCLRKKSFFNATKSEGEYQSNIMDLKDFLEVDIKQLSQKNILLEEKDVDYDLLDRNIIINQLYNIITMTNPREKFVISLEGKWGSGKTTILKNVKKKIIQNNKDIVLIDEFDPWVFSDEEALLLDMMNTIIQKSELKYSTLFNSGLVENLSGLILGSERKGIIKSLFPSDIVAELKSKINNYLRMANKKIVFFLDNIDRSERENIIFLFKLVGNVLDFERITYVLAFDTERVKRIFEDDSILNPDYFKKIINYNFHVPEIDRDILGNLYFNTLNKILLLNGEEENEISKYEFLINYLCDQSVDLRDFKIFINSVVTQNIQPIQNLSKIDLLVINYIKIFNFSLYLSIYHNRNFYIYYDRDPEYGFARVLSNIKQEEYDTEEKKYFEDLFKENKNKKFKPLLEEIFPSVLKYDKSSFDLRITEHQAEKGAAKASKEKRICSGKFFELYFTETENEFVAISKLIQSFVNNLNIVQTYKEREGLFIDMIDKLETDYHREAFNLIQIYLNDVKAEDGLSDLLIILFKNIELADNRYLFMKKNASERTLIIINDLLQLISDSEFEKFINMIKFNYKKLQILRRIISLNNNPNTEDMKKRISVLNSLLESMVNEILESKINLYLDSNYMFKNIWGLYFVLQERQKDFSNYIDQVMNEKNIFRILYDMVTVSISSWYIYSINDKKLSYMTTIEKIDTVLDGVEAKSDDEKFVLDIYNEFKANPKTDIFDDYGVHSINERKLNL